MTLRTTGLETINRETESDELQKTQPGERPMRFGDVLKMAAPEILAIDGRWEYAANFSTGLKGAETREAFEDLVFYFHQVVEHDVDADIKGGKVPEEDRNDTIYFRFQNTAEQLCKNIKATARTPEILQGAPMAELIEQSYKEVLEEAPSYEETVAKIKAEMLIPEKAFLTKAEQGVKKYVQHLKEYYGKDHHLSMHMLLGLRLFVGQHGQGQVGGHELHHDDDRATDYNATDGPVATIGTYENQSNTYMVPDAGLEQEEVSYVPNDTATSSLAGVENALGRQNSDETVSISKDLFIKFFEYHEAHSDENNHFANMVMGEEYSTERGIHDEI